MKLTEMTTLEVDRLSRKVVVLFPIAALEQHSGHLPVFTDSFLCGTVAEQVEANLPKDVLLLPVQWLGSSSHHLSFPGSLSAELDTHVQVICQTLSSLLDHGFANMLVLNGHGGNQDPMHVALRKLTLKYPKANLAAASYWDIAEQTIANHLTGPLKQVGHAGEMETALMMAVRPDLVKTRLIRDDPPRNDSRLGGVFIAPDMRRYTGQGSVGYATKASASQGKRLLKAIIKDVTAAVAILRKNATRATSKSTTARSGRKKQAKRVKKLSR